MFPHAAESRPSVSTKQQNRKGFSVKGLCAASEGRYKRALPVEFPPRLQFASGAGVHESVGVRRRRLRRLRRKCNELQVYEKDFVEPRRNVAYGLP